MPSVIDTNSKIEWVVLEGGDTIEKFNSFVNPYSIIEPAYYVKDYLIWNIF